MIKKYVGTLKFENGYYFLHDKFKNANVNLTDILHNTNKISFVINNDFRKELRQGQVRYDLYNQIGGNHNKAFDILNNNIGRLLEIIVDDDIEHSLNNIPNIGYKINLR